MSIAISEIPGAGPLAPHSGGDVWDVWATLTFSGNYTTGGDITLSEKIEAQLKQVGTGTVIWLDVQGDTKGFVFAYNYSTKKLQLYRTGAALKGQLEEFPEEAYPAAITGATVRCYAIGK